MLIRRFVVRISSVAMMFLGAGAVSGQTYPNRPIRIVTGSSGSGVDFTARLVAQGITGPLGQQVIVDNRPSGVIPGETVAKAPPDGYTLLFYSGSFWIGSLLRKTPYDPVRDFSTITLVTRSPNILIVHPSLPVASVKELIALAKARPGELNYSSGTAGGSSHLAAELFKAMAGVNIVRIPYKSSSTQMADLIGGYVQLTFDGASLLMPHVRSGKLRALAVTSAKPSPLAPGLPTVAASGLPGYESAAIYGMFAPVETLGAIINRMNQEVVRFLNRADTKQKLFDTGVETVASSPEEFAAVIKSDMARMGKVIKDAGIKAD